MTISYKKAGVDITEIKKSQRAIGKLIGSTHNLQKMAKMTHGFGHYAGIVEIPGGKLLAKANETTPDPLAAATIIDAVNRVYETEINTKNLKKQKKQIGVDLRELSDKYSEHKKIDSNMYM